MSYVIGGFSWLMGLCYGILFTMHDVMVSILLAI